MTKETKPQLQWGDWLLTIGGIVFMIGLLWAISAIWTPDTQAETAGSSHLMNAVITAVVGLVLAGVSIVLKRRS